ncbi:MAG: N-6 DNA methylase, partial [Planctomycetaceae bacterium]|nr:N-6 DNA methylase [Planctomycetaceae bacterium]
MKIYAYTTPDIAKHAGYLKIGETHGGVAERVKQQGHELNVKHEVVWHDAVITERVGIDKMIHRYLKDQGFPIQQFEATGYDTEWVRCDVADLKKAFDAVKKQLYSDEVARQALCDKFFLEIRNWYYWTVRTDDTPLFVTDPEAAIRLVVRLLFCYFLREKGLVPKELFDERFIHEHFRENEEYRYYHAVLRNLFFHCLNTPIKERRELEHKRLIKNVRRVKDQFDQIPFINGGLFNEQDGDKIPFRNEFFFAELQTRHIPALGGSYKVAGIIRILSQYRYKLTVDDLLDRDYAETVDPEFIGRVFESLLACIDADSSETRRKVTGSFYTPREVVDYMVNEALDAYLQNHDDILECKILDPACGSGAFPCGIMNEIMRRFDPNKTLSPEERYRRKLEILHKVIYGVDIQPIAVQISLLRLFLSLIQEIVPDKRRENYGIKPLPNLETKFLCADSLIGLKNGRQRMLEFPAVREATKQLQETRRRYFMTSDVQAKQILRQDDETQRKILAILMED